MMTIHYAYQQLEKLRGESDIVKLFALVDGVQYDRAFGESLEESQSIRSLLYLPEDKAIAFAGPWLLDTGEVSQEHYLKLVQLEKKYPAVSWIISDQPFVTLARHLGFCLRVSLPSGKTGLFRFYDCRILKILPDLLSSEQVAQLMKHSLRWLFLNEDGINSYQYDVNVLNMNILENSTDSREA